MVVSVTVDQYSASTNVSKVPGSLQNMMSAVMKTYRQTSASTETSVFFSDANTFATTVS